MYRDEGYGQNWQPASAANARRIDPYTRSCAILGSLFAIGFVLIVIVVLSLIPIYLSHQSSTKKTNIQVAKISIPDYTLIVRSSSLIWNSPLILSQIDHRQALEAALTSLIQKENNLAGSIVDINLPLSSSSSSSRKRRRAVSTPFNVTLNVEITSNRTCGSIFCLNQFQNQINQVLTEINANRAMLPYQPSNSTEIEWISYQFPTNILSSVSSVFVDPTMIANQLEKLLVLDQTRAQLWESSFTQTTVAISG